MFPGHEFAITGKYVRDADCCGAWSRRTCGAACCDDKYSQCAVYGAVLASPAAAASPLASISTARPREVGLPTNKANGTGFGCAVSYDMDEVLPGPRAARRAGGRREAYATWAADFTWFMRLLNLR